MNYDSTASSCPHVYSGQTLGNNVELANDTSVENIRYSGVFFENKNLTGNHFIDCCTTCKTNSYRGIAANAAWVIGQKDVVTSPTPRKDNPAKDAICHQCGEVGDWRRNCHVYLIEWMKKEEATSGELASSGNMERELRVSCYTDVGYLTDADDLKSQTGYVFVLNGGAVDWKSTKQKLVPKGGGIGGMVPNMIGS
ncbi:hypothetical protein Tco_1057120 [Tanacetum coccineum]|uniref:Zinc finger, CCHC-type n=1 Tax=Tanacetum coccineum TaxID=301880 RepID=A0ABQ5H6J8_9ASTR